MNSSFKNGETFNIGTGTTVSINKAAGFFKCPIEYIPPRAGDAKCYLANIDKTKKLLRWEPRISFAEGIKGYLSGKI